MNRSKSELIISGVHKNDPIPELTKTEKIGSLILFFLFLALIGGTIYGIYVLDNGTPKVPKYGLIIITLGFLLVLLVAGAVGSITGIFALGWRLDDNAN